MRTGRLIIGVCLVALMMGANAWADVITPVEADFAYEGNDVPPAGGWDTMVVDLMSGYSTKTVDGMIYTRAIAPPMDSGNDYFVLAKYHVLNSTTFTIDFRVARDILSGVNANDSDYGIGLSIHADLDGGGAGTDLRRLDFNPGHGGIPGQNNADLTIKDSVRMWDDAGSALHVGITGLNVDEFNTYRVVGMGDNTYKIYVNDTVAPIITGTMKAIAADARAGEVNMVGQCETLATETYTADWKVDFLRVLDGEARDEAPGTHYPVVSVRPDHDNDTDSVAPTTVQDHEANLDASGSRVAWLKFDITGIPDGATIDTATLTMRTRNDTTTDAPTDVKEVSDDTWLETTITHATAPTVGAVIGSFLVVGTGSTGASQLADIDVTSWVQSNINNNDQLISFCIEHDAGPPWVWFRADEHTTQTEHPWALLSVTTMKPPPRGTTIVIR